MTPEPAELTPDLNTVRLLRRRMLAWYRRNRRDLPWRRDPLPYHILVSEMMAQQTQIATVIDYYHRFLDSFPTVEALASASEQEVLRLWQGLGYYRRARHLHAAAKAIVEQFGGELPDNVDDLLSLPGVGRYTAGAIASVAFDKPAPIVDGNVVRVLCRWFAIDLPADDPKTIKQLWSLAATLVPKKEPGDFNQSVMELGAMVCSPRNPSCLVCPVASVCEANQQGRASELPVKGKRVKVKSVTHHVAAIERGGKLLFTQRPADGLWSNMWQMPTAESLNGNDVSAWASEQTGLTLRDAEEVGRFKHQTTHRTITFVVWSLPVAGGRLRRGAGVWRKPHDIDDLPLPNPQRKSLAIASAIKKAPH